MVSKKIQAAHSEDAFLGIDDNTVFWQACEQGAKMVFMLIGCLTGDQQVVDIRKDERETTSNLVQETLETLSSVPKTKWHSNELKNPTRGGNGRLVNVIRVDWNLVVRSN